MCNLLKKVLLVEDEEWIMKWLQFAIDWLSLGCIICATAKDGREGIEKICEHRPDIVMTDIRMPYVDGLLMLQETYESYDYEAIIMSGYDEFSYAQRAMSLGVSQYLLKPATDQEVARAILQVHKKLGERSALCIPQSSGEDPSALILPNRYVMGEDKRVDRMIAFIQTHYAEKISIKDVSEAMALSVSYLQSTFKQRTGYTFHVFLNRYRIQKAVRHIQNSDRKIYEIAEMVGIPDYKYFNYVFKKYTGWAPSRFM